MVEADHRPLMLWAAMGLAAALLFGGRLYAQWPVTPAMPDAGIDLQRVILFYSTLPRAVVAVLAGAALALSGLLLQRVLRNPLAEPSTLGISAGAQLALAAAAIHAPWLIGWSRGTVAFAGGVAAVALILALTWRRGLEPVSVVLAGMMVALTANAASGALILANGEYLFSLFIWGGGSLVQQDWGPSIAIGLRLAVGFVAAMLLLRPLAILGLDDASARSLGVALHVSRLLVIAIAVWIATTVVAEVGIIGFVGLAGPALATLSGARSLRSRLIAAPLIGAALLWLTDGLVQLSGASGERIPTGAATALLGGPLLLWLLPRLRMFEWPSLSTSGTDIRRSGRPWRLVACIVAMGLAACCIALSVGQGHDGWTVATGDLLSELAAWRAPRVVVAAAAGGMLAAAGTVIQRVTGNPLASPEVLGVGAGAGAGLAAVLMVSGVAGIAWQVAASVAGAVVTLIAMLAIASRGKFGPERVLLAGIALGAFCSALITAVIALGNMQSYILLRWLSGSTNGVDAPQAWFAATALVVLAAPLFVFGRWMDILPLGTAIASSLGVPLRRAHLVLVLFSALLSAISALFIGPLSFIGLVAPHMARLLGSAVPGSSSPAPSSSACC